jgi:putative intracellular protease/amidase
MFLGRTTVYKYIVKRNSHVIIKNIASNFINTRIDTIPPSKDRNSKPSFQSPNRIPILRPRPLSNMSPTAPPKNIGVVLFPGFQLLDICGPLDVLNLLAASQTLNLSILADTLDPVHTGHSLQENQHSHFSQSIVPTHTFATAPQDLEVLIIPGGFGARKEENIDGVVEFMKGYYSKLRWCLTVCTGSAILAKSGVLNGRRATSNKKAFAWVCVLQS